MKLIQSHDIQGKLLDVILKARQELVIVSPYVNLTYSKQVSAALVAARNRGVCVSFYIREDATTYNGESKKHVQDMGFTPRLIPNLHAKLYFNETTGIITSLNLLSSSLGSSIEIGGQLETAEELEELRLFVAQFLTPHEVGARRLTVPITPPAPVNSAPIATGILKPLSHQEQRLAQQPFGAVLADFLSREVDHKCTVEETPSGNLAIRALRNTFTATIDSPRFDAVNQLFLLAVVSGAEVERFRRSVATDFPSPGYTRFIKAGSKGYYDQLKSVRNEKLSAATFNQLQVEEKKVLLQEVATFIKETAAFKKNHAG
jgi:hypothetical protein